MVLTEKEIKQLFREAGNSITTLNRNIQAMFEYFQLKNKVLWSSSTSWASGTKTIPDISKYQTIQVGVGLGSHEGMLYRHGESFRGSAVIGYDTWMATQSFVLTLNGDSVTISENQMVGHNGSGNHDAMKNKYYGISQLTGIDPIIPDNLLEIIGGGTA